MKRAIIELSGAADVSPQEWNAAAANAPMYLNHAWVHFADGQTPAQPVHGVLRDSDGLYAALPTYGMGAEPPVYYDLDGMLGLPAGDPRPVRIGGTRVGYCSGLVLAPDRPSAGARVAVNDLVAWFRDRSRDAGERAAFLYLTDEALDALLPALGPSDRISLIDSYCRLPVPEGGIEEYLGGFSRRRAAAFRRDMKRFAGSDLQLRIAPLEPPFEHLGELIAQVGRRYGHSDTADFFANQLARHYDCFDQCLLVEAVLDGEVVGFTQFFPWDNTLYGRYHGIDDKHGRRAALYYNLTYYEALRWAAEHSFAWLDLSCGSQDAKVYRGTTLEALWAVELDAAWSEDSTQVEQVRALERDRVAEFGALDPGVISAVARRVAAREGWVPPDFGLRPSRAADD